MSVIEFHSMSKFEYICQFIVESRGSGLFLSPEDQAVVEDWLEKSAGDEQKLLLALDEVLPEYFNKEKKNRMPLARIQKAVRSRLLTLS